MPLTAWQALPAVTGPIDPASMNLDIPSRLGRARGATCCYGGAISFRTFKESRSDPSVGTITHKAPSAVEIVVLEEHIPLSPLQEVQHQDVGFAKVQERLAYGCGTTMHVVHLQAVRVGGENHTKYIDFTPRSIRTRWVAGYADTLNALERCAWLQRSDPIEGIVEH